MALCFMKTCLKPVNYDSRISRIAVQPNYSESGIGQNLMQAMENADVDFLSVSFKHRTNWQNFLAKVRFCFGI